MLLSFTPVIFGNYVSASTNAANFLPNLLAPVDTQNEITLSENTANYIVSLLKSRYPATIDRRNSSCTDVDFNNTLTALQNYGTSVIYSKGHRGAYTTPTGYVHYGLAMNNNGTVYDYQIFNRLTKQNVAVAFIWHCETGLIPSLTYEQGVGYCGLPIAFTNTPGISQNGTSGSKVYLGWTNNVPPFFYQPGGSPQYEYTIRTPPNTVYNFANVAALFWMYMDQGCSAYQALINLSNTIYGKTYASSEIAGWLVIYGNVNLGLPP